MTQNIFETVYTYDEQGFLIGETDAQKDKNGFLMLPPMSTSVNPPVSPPSKGTMYAFIGGKWVEKALPVAEAEEEPTPLTVEEQNLIDIQIIEAELQQLDLKELPLYLRMVEDQRQGLEPYPNTIAAMDEIDTQKAPLRARLTELKAENPQLKAE